VLPTFLAFLFLPICNKEDKLFMPLLMEPEKGQGIRTPRLLPSRLLNVPVNKRQLLSSAALY